MICGVLDGRNKTLSAVCASGGSDVSVVSRHFQYHRPLDVPRGPARRRSVAAAAASPDHPGRPRGGGGGAGAALVGGPGRAVAAGEGCVGRRGGVAAPRRRRRVAVVGQCPSAVGQRPRQPAVRLVVEQGRLRTRLAASTLRTAAKHGNFRRQMMCISLNTVNVWNSLPSDVTSASLLPVFKNRLKTYLFRRCYETVRLRITFLFPSHYLPSRTVVLEIVFTV